MSIKKAKERLMESLKDRITNDPQVKFLVHSVLEELDHVDPYRPEIHEVKPGGIPSLEGTVETHESFGMLDISRVSANPRINLFGSDIKHGNFIALRIKRGECVRSLNRDRYHDRGTLVEVWMSEVQFAQAITTLNFGSGVPVTLTRVMGEGMEECPSRTKLGTVHDEFQAKMSKIGKQVANLDKSIKDLLDSPGQVKVGDKKKIKEDLERLLMNIESNLPFMAEQFSNTMDDIVTQAKGEVEAYVLNSIQKAGLKAVGDGSGPGIDLALPGGTLEGEADGNNGG